MLHNLSIIGYSIEHFALGYFLLVVVFATIFRKTIFAGGLGMQ